MKYSSLSFKRTMSDRLRNLREKLGLTQNDLANQLGMKIKPISNIENKIQLPTIPMLVSLFKIYRVSPLWFLMGVGDMFLSSLEGTSDQVEIFQKAFPGVPAEPDVIKVIESMAVPVLKNAIILKSLELMEVYRPQIEKYIKPKVSDYEKNVAKSSLLR